MYTHTYTFHSNINYFVIIIINILLHIYIKTFAEEDYQKEEREKDLEESQSLC